MFTAATFIFSSARFLNMWKPRTCCPTSTDILGSGLACLPRWLGMMNTGWLVSTRSEISLQMTFIKFKVVPSNRLPFYLASPLHVIRSLFSQKCWSLGFEAFSPFFSEFSFHWLQPLFSLVLFICLSWYLDLTLPHEFLTFMSFNIWR